MKNILIAFVFLFIWSKKLDTSYSSEASHSKEKSLLLFSGCFWVFFIDLLFKSQRKTYAPLERQTFVVAQPIPDAFRP